MPASPPPVVKPVPAWWWLVLSVGMTWLFWPALWTSGGLVGGDVYSYSLPQKTFLADSLHTGVIPLWNPLTGHGYPVLGESQTGALYPLHLLVYSLLDVGTGWNVVLIGHYVAAFIAMAWCARAFGVTGPGALLAAVVYVYAWFPVRAFLDWAILGGVYLPLALGAAERFFVTGRSRFLALLSVSFALQLLGGHYQIAFCTWLLGGAFVLFRSLYLLRVPLAPPVPSSFQGPEEHWQSQWHTRHARSTLCIAIAFVFGVALAAPQLLASWELKSRSQRAAVGADHDPAYGHIPPGYLTQIIAPWFWYDAQLDLDAALQRLPLGQIASGTNKVEAHCYFGVAPTLLLIAWALLALRRRAFRAQDIFWLCVIMASLIYATGWLMPVMKVIPGFNFFRGPGRASILATFAVALLVGRLLDAWVAGITCPNRRRAVIVGMLGVTIFDLWFVPTTVSYAVVVSQPPIAFRADSPVRKLLLAEPGPVRLYAPGANVPNLLGVASTPVYLGFGPREYFAPEFTLPEADPPDFHAFTSQRLQWLRNAGVTHVLSFEPLERRGWPVELLWAGLDPMLNRAWARQEPLFLYRLHDATGRFRWDGGVGSVGVVDYGPHQIHVRAEVTAVGTLVLTDLDDPDWIVTVDGQLASSSRINMYRGVALSAGSHEVVWSYRPRSVYWGAILSAGALLLLLTMGWYGRRTW
ncbi:MAG TPA: hypothetical protein VFG20_09930 [Planctomycetaceae bacterium]|nr:hypothetical protein [Planctomycetaceae bacterium]